VEIQMTTETMEMRPVSRESKRPPMTSCETPNSLAKGRRL
jgi:hypothetical protein